MNDDNVFHLKQPEENASDTLKEPLRKGTKDLITQAVNMKHRVIGPPAPLYATFIKFSRVCYIFRNHSDEQKRIYRSREQWQQLIQDFEPSRETVSGFCKRRGISDSLFYTWHKKLAAGMKGSCSPELFIEYPSQMSLSSAEQSSSWDVELDLGDMVLRIRRA